MLACFLAPTGFLTLSLAAAFFGGGGAFLIYGYEVWFDAYADPSALSSIDLFLGSGCGCLSLKSLV